MRLSLSRAFTLLELLIVLLIIGVLIVIGLFKYQSVVDTANRQEAQVQVRAVFINANAQRASNGNDSYLVTGSLVSQITGQDGITVTAFDGSEDDAPNASVGVLVSGDNNEQIIVAKESEDGTVVYCMQDTGNAIIVGKLEASECVGTTNAAPVVPDTIVAQIAVGNQHTCMLNSEGAVLCWGSGGNGRLGYGNTNVVGDDETPISVGFVDLGTNTAKKIATGENHTCVILDSNDVKCWGANGSGQLGNGNTDAIGDDEAAALSPTVNLGTHTAKAIATGARFTCVILENDQVQCWGANTFGQLGYGHTDNLGDNEALIADSYVNLGSGRTAKSISASWNHICAILDNDEAKCWGEGTDGRLGQNSESHIGNSLTPGDFSSIALGTTAKGIDTGYSSSCALLSTDQVKCFGWGQSGQLGLGNTNDIGDNETPDMVVPISLGQNAKEVSAGELHACAILTDDTVKCWGEGLLGRLGYGTGTADLGDNELPSAVASLVDIGTATPSQISVGAQHACVLTTDERVVCWGNVNNGRLGYGAGTTTNIGDNETPASAGFVPIS